MPDKNKANGDGDEAAKINNNGAYGNLRWIAAWAGIAVVVLLLVSVRHPNMVERVKFFTANLLSLFILIAVVVQAYIYRRQWEAMQRQGTAMQAQLAAMQDQAISMKESLEETRKLIAQNERAVLATEQNAATAREAMYLAISPRFGITEIQFDWLTEISNIGTGPKSGFQPIITITFLNSGQAAYHFTAIPKLILGESLETGTDFSLSVYVFTSHPTEELTFYAPGAQNRIEYQSDLLFTASQVSAVSTHETQLFLLVEVEFNNILTAWQTQKFRRVFDPRTSRFRDLPRNQKEENPNKDSP